MIRLAALLGLIATGAIAGCGEQPRDSEAEPAGTAASACLTDLPGEPVAIPAGRFIMGADPRYPEEGPPREIAVAAFAIDSHEVTNVQFAAFVEATGYTTLAEQPPPRLEGAPPEMLEPGSAVFHTPSRGDPRWWRWVVGANWRHPEGPGSTIEGRENEPVVQIAYSDAQAYADWAGGSLPSEAQWEYAARAGGSVIAEPLDGDGNPAANYYQGIFPQRDLGADGYAGRAPAGCFPPNAFGLYDMIGNVWEWTSEPGGPLPDSAVIKGGSFLCAANYCARYRPAARQFQERGLGTDHIGFRLVYPAPGR